MSENKCEVTDLICEQLCADLKMYEQIAHLHFAENNELTKGSYPKCYYLIRALTVHLGVEALERIDSDRAKEFKNNDVFKMLMANAEIERQAQLEEKAKCHG